MNRLAVFVAALLFSGTLVLAHGGNEHVRGVVTQVSAQSITVQTATKATRTLTLGPKTTLTRPTGRSALRWSDGPIPANRR